jgi:oxygen-independent coproporphyrinogen-3 oxidase
MDFAIWATVQPTAAAASAAVRVPAGNSEIVSGWPAAASAARTRSTEPPDSLADILYLPAMEPLALYIHWPFCLAKCPYCDFNSHVRERIPQARFRAALLRALTWEANRLGPRRLTSIFFGGGTPSLMEPETVGALIDDAHRLFRPAENIEITLEANPTSVEAGRFAAFRDAGVNRVSIGVQSLDQQALSLLGRQHSAAQAIDALETARAIFPRISFDLIYARPGQTLATWRAELRRALALAADHLSLYQLTIEPGTKFAAMHRRGEIKLPDEDAAAALYETTAEEAARFGLLAYEVSNYAVPGSESRHNLTYWRYGDYAGIGPGAHGRITRIGATPSCIFATRCHRAPEPWAELVERDGHGIVEELALQPIERGREMLLMGLRLVEGIDPALFAARTGVSLNDALDKPILQRAVEEDYLAWRDGRLAATTAGRLRLDALLAAIVH